MAETYVVEPDLEFIKEVGALGGEDLKKCYQCATCSVACAISPDTKPFPRKEMIAALIEPNVDRAELDRIRSAEMALMERGSRRIVTALADAADMLTPEQRAQLAQMAERWTGHGHRL